MYDAFLTFTTLLGIGSIFYISIEQYRQHQRAIQRGVERIRQDVTVNNRLRLSRIQLNRCRLAKCRSNLQTKKPYEFIDLDKPNREESENNEEEEQDGILIIDNNEN